VSGITGWVLAKADSGGECDAAVKAMIATAGTAEKA
jgi:hypothetical protein